MSLLRILRNLAVLVILTVGGLGVTPRQAAANQCGGGGARCTIHKPCCVGFVCSGGSCLACVGYQHLCSAAHPCCPGLFCVPIDGTGLAECI
jgi:hypothetical protein